MYEGTFHAIVAVLRQIVQLVQMGGYDLIQLNYRDSKPIYEQITAQIKNSILNGELQEGEALPSMRALAKDLRISVITTKRAYEDLERDGFVVTVAGKGCFVAPKNLELMREEQRKKVEGALQCAVDQAKAASIDLEELKEMLSLLYEE